MRGRFQSHETRDCQLPFLIDNSSAILGIYRSNMMMENVRAVYEIPTVVT